MMSLMYAVCTVAKTWVAEFKYSQSGTIDKH